MTSDERALEPLHLSQDEDDLAPERLLVFRQIRQLCGCDVLRDSLGWQRLPGLTRAGEAVCAALVLHFACTPGCWQHSSSDRSLKATLIVSCGVRK